MFETKLEERCWNQFIKKYSIDTLQQEKFKKYLDFILQENQKYNLTAITSVQGVIADHFFDSLSLTRLADLSKVKTIADIGSGGGFPGVPVAIMNPAVTVHIVEVNGKKVTFLNMLKELINLDNLVVHQQDFRTFIRKFEKPIDLFTARASLPLAELTRVFKPSSIHKSCLLVYWASKKWVPTEQEKVYLDTCISYQVGDKKRSLCFFYHKDFNTVKVHVEN